jgi:hypothetical protein
MEASPPTKSYRDWRDAVDMHLHRIYCITIEDAGFGEDYLMDHWQSNEAPVEFVEWFGNKYDLTPRSDIEWGIARPSPLKTTSR